MLRGNTVLGAAFLIAATLSAACAGGSSAETEPLNVQDVLVDGERLEYTVLDRLGAVVGEGTVSASRQRDGWLLEQRFEESAAVGDRAAHQDTSTVATNAELLPVWSERTVVGTETTESYRMEYDHGAEEAVSLVTRDGDQERREARLRTPIYDNESALWLWRALPLREDFQARYLTMNPLDRSQQTVALSITERVEIEVPAGTFDTWRLQVRSGRATGVAWIEVEAPHRVVQWDNGATTLQLTVAESPSP